MEASEWAMIESEREGCESLRMWDKNKRVCGGIDGKSSG